MNFFNYIEQKKLSQDFDKKLKNSKTLGTDGVTVEKFGNILDDEIDIINRKVKNSTYKFSRYQEKLILKGKDKLPRVIQIPTHRDKLLLNALREYLVDSFKEKIVDTTLHQKISTIKELTESKKFDSFIKIDIQNFYPSINHEILLKKVSKVAKDKYALEILKKAIECNEVGIPQGLSISNILSSIYMQELDKFYSSKTTIAYFRYVDDILIFCNKNNIKRTINSLRKKIDALKLTMHSFEDDYDKSVVGNIHENSFQYLGHEFSNSKITVRQSSIEKFQNRILELFKIYKNSSDYELQKAINLKISGCIYDGKQYGWMHFFGLANDMELFYKLDWFVKKCFKQYNRKYDESKVKRFTKVYFKLKNLDIKKLDNKSYIPKFDSSKNIEKVIISLQKDIEFY